MIRSRSTTTAAGLSCIQNTHKDLEAHPASYAMGTGLYFGDRVTGAWRWSRYLHLVWSLNLSGDTSALPCKCSRHGHQLLYIYFELGALDGTGHRVPGVLVPALRNSVNSKQKVYRDSPNPYANLWEYFELIYSAFIATI